MMARHPDFAGRLVGHFFIHNADDSAFIAERE